MTAAHRPILRAGIFAVIGLAGVIGGCTKKMDAKRKEMLASATACPAPATCTGKTRASEMDLPTCLPSPESQAYAVGDTVVVKDYGVVNTIAQVKKHDGRTYMVEFADGYVLERTADALIARVCTAKN